MNPKTQTTDFRHMYTICITYAVKISDLGKSMGLESITTSTKAVVLNLFTLAIPSLKPMTQLFVLRGREKRRKRR